MRTVAVLLVLAFTAGCLGAVELDDEPTIETDDEPAATVDADGDLVVHAIDVGQADATLVETPEDEVILVDSGDWRADGEAVIDYLDAQDIDRIDYLVTTHPHADHIGGHAAVIETFETERDGIGEVWDPGVAHTSQTYERYLDAVEAHDVTLIDAQEGDELGLDGASTKVLNPPESPGTDDLHHNSLTLEIAFGETTVLLTGDAEADAEDRMVDTYDDLDADIYHAGHHGSSTSSTEPFLSTLDPAATIISAAYDSQYGHPHDEVLDRFAGHGIDTYWTGIHGTIVFETDGETITASTGTAATTDPTEVRDAEPAETDPTATVDQRETYEVTTATVHASPVAALTTTRASMHHQSVTP